MATRENAENLELEGEVRRALEAVEADLSDLVIQPGMVIDFQEVVRRGRTWEPVRSPVTGHKVSGRFKNPGPINQATPGHRTGDVVEVLLKPRTDQERTAYFLIHDVRKPQE